MKKIFEDAYFGKVYKTRDGRKAIYVGGYRCVIETDTNHLFRFRSNGMYEGWSTSLDIVSEWQEPIDEEELGELAEEFANKYSIPHTQQSSDLQCGFKAGYINGATDQRKIDIDKACYLVYEQIAALIGYTKSAEDIAYKDFKEAMEEEQC